jgi:hypothetical protein
MSIKSSISTIWEGVKELFRSIGRSIKKVVTQLLNFAKLVVQYFKEMYLNPETDTPFIIDAEKLGEQIQNAPRVDVGIFEGVYHADTNSISNYRIIEADQLDDDTKKVMSQAKDGIAVLQ